MRRSAVTKICCLTWSDACSKTAPTPASSIASPTKASRSAELVPIQPIPCAASSRSLIPASHCRSPCTAASRGRNSMGVNLANDDAAAQLAPPSMPSPMGVDAAGRWCRARTNGRMERGAPPADRREVIGHWQAADPATVERALQNAVSRAGNGWDATPAAARAKILEHAADLLEARMPSTWRCAPSEAGKTLPDGIAEVREAVDFCRYYAQQAREISQPISAARPDRRIQPLQLHGRGVFVCISRGTSRWRSSWARSRRAGRRQQRDRQARRTDQPDRRMPR
jgi:delta 1-pyrroline-5-carboxylate dehydrogenase